MAKGLDSMAEKAAKKAAERKLKKAQQVDEKAEAVEVNAEAEAFIDGAAYATDKKPEKPVVKMKRLNVNIPEELHNKIKMASAYRGMSLNEAVLKWAVRYAKRNESDQTWYE